MQSGKTNSTKLYAGNLDPKLTEYQFVKVFSQFGVIVKEEFLWHKDGPRKGQPRGYAFVEFATRAEAEKAIAHLDGKPLLGRTMVVRFAEARRTKDGKKFEKGAKMDKQRQIAAIQKKLKSMDQGTSSGG